MAGLDEGTPLFVQVADRLAGEIADGGLAEGERVPSTNELAAFYRINPATAAKGVNAGRRRADREAEGHWHVRDRRPARCARRREEFARRFVEPLLAEAAGLGIDTDDLRPDRGSRRAGRLL